MMPSPTDQTKDLAAAAQQDSYSPDQLVALRINVAIGQRQLLSAFPTRRLAQPDRQLSA
jgi:hypothetical protein